MNNLPRVIPSVGLVKLIENKELTSADFFKREILVLQCLVAGTSFRNIHKVEQQLVPQTKLTLKREPDNEHDELAIKVLLDDYFIGYIPRDSNEVLARLMDAGKKFEGTVVELEWQGAWARLDIDVFLIE